MLPGFGEGRSSRFSSSSIIPEYARRIIQYPQMDIEYTFWQMFYLCIDPTRVYRTTSWHKQTKNQWARDDPAFVAMLAFFLAVASLSFSVAFQAESFLNMLKLLFWTICVDFIAAGVAIATVEWWIANRFLRVQSIHTLEQRVEWLYAFDVHCNSFFPLFLILYVLQFYFLPVLVAPGIVSAFFSNSMYAIAVSYYCYITFLGYDALPFLPKEHSVYFLYPIGFIALVYVVLMIPGWNCTIFFMNFYFGK